MTMTSALAIYAAVLSTITLIVGYLRERRNQPRLRVTVAYELEAEPHPDDPRGHCAIVSVSVVNTARTPTSVIAVYLMTAATGNSPLVAM